MEKLLWVGGGGFYFIYKNKNVMKQKHKTMMSNPQQNPKFRKLTKRKQQRPFKNEEIPIVKIRKDYEKFTL